MNNESNIRIGMDCKIYTTYEEDIINVTDVNRNKTQTSTNIKHNQSVLKIKTSMKIKNELKEAAFC